MKKLTLKQILAILLAAVTLLLSACTPDDPMVDTTTEAPADDDTTTTGDVGDNETTAAPVDNPSGPDDGVIPTVSSSKELLTFTPAAPDKLVLDEKGNCAPIVIENYNETATDDLGRVLITSEQAGLPNSQKWVGLFYSIWTAADGGSVGSTLDVTKALASNPQNPYYASKGTFNWWAEPETGYHAADDVWQIRRDMRYFAMAGVDFIYVDFTNGLLYNAAFKTLLDTMATMRKEGQMTPYVVPWVLDGAGEQSLVNQAYREFYSKEKYNDLWFRWEGKPLILLKRTESGGQLPSLADSRLTDYFTFRLGWGNTLWPGVEEPNYNLWGDVTTLGRDERFGWHDDPSKAEQMGIGLAGFAAYGSGRSYRYSNPGFVDHFLETKTMGEGINFAACFEKVKKHPECQVLMISRWNEWVAQYLVSTHDFGFVDQFNREFSRDIEPMKGGFTDNYFYQMCNIIREYKGVLPAEGNTGAQTMDVNTGDFEKWEKIMPVFTDYENDTKWRNSTDPTGEITYRDSTGRNDVVESRLTADGGMVYAYVRCADKIPSFSRNPNWMMLFIDADQNKETGWEGYDFVINYKVLDNTATTICAYKDGIWQEIGVVQYKREGDRMMIAIPRSLLGLTGDKVAVDFHWMDNVTDIYDLHSWFTTGDSAPERRNNYTISLDVPYNASAETVIPGRTEGALTYMPAVTLDDKLEPQLQKGLNRTVYHLPLILDKKGNKTTYGKMPEFDQLDYNRIGTDVAQAIHADVGFRVSNYALSYDGYVKIPEDGEYRFRIACDDAAILYIDGRVITEVAYDAERASGEIVVGAASIRLAAGYHAFKLEYAEIGNGGGMLALDGDWEFYRAPFVPVAGDIEVFYDPNVDTVNFNGVTAAQGTPIVNETGVQNVNQSVVLNLGYWDLANYAALEVDYCSDAYAMFGDAGGYFAVSYDAQTVTTPEGHPYVLGKGAMSNPKGPWMMDVRTATVDLSEVAYAGDVYLAMYAGCHHGVRITKIRLIKAEEPTPMPEGGYPAVPNPGDGNTPEITDGMDLTQVVKVHGPATIGTSISDVLGGTVLNLGEWNLADFDAIEIFYCSAATAMMGDLGNYFAITDQTDTINSATPPAHVMASARMTNAAGAWAEDIRTATLDLRQLTYEGVLYLSTYMADANGLTIKGIRMIPAGEYQPDDDPVVTPPATGDGMDLTQVVKVHGPAKIGSSITDVLGGTVLNLGEWNLADFDAIEILYCSAATAMMGDAGNYFAITDQTDTINSATPPAHVMASARMTNAAGAWREDIRTATLDLRDLTYEGVVYLSTYMPDPNGLTIIAIRMIPAGEYTPDDDPVVTPPATGDGMDLTQVVKVHGPAKIGSSITDVTGGTVLNLGEWNLADFDAVEILYCSDAKAMMGDAGNYFAITDQTDTLDSATPPEHVMATAPMTNAAGAWREDIRTATIDLRDLTYEGTLYLSTYMPDPNGCTITAIRFVPSETSET